ncbi:DUF2633 family protein [Rahnella sp. SAP-1]|uniref:DUF2633 family protein n=1 Tax=Rouxiella aceris TaxID=2703884 RepID=A0A848MPH3_9GAMM|nr:DUF2633 family protein [Rouxiella aceris]
MHRRNNVKLTKIVLTISFIILFGRFIYATIGSYSQHKSLQQAETEQGIAPVDQENQTDNTQ